MKKYEKPDVEIIRFMSAEAIADSVGDTDEGITSNNDFIPPWLRNVVQDDPDRTR